MALRFRTRLSLAISALLFLTVASMTMAVTFILVRNMTQQYQNTGAILTQLANRNIEYGVGLPAKVIARVEDQMVVHALLTSELVALAEAKGAATPEEISAALRRVVSRKQDP